MKKKNGFTLVELISVLGILGLLLLITVPNIANISNRSNMSLKDSKIKTLETLGERYGNAAINKYQKCIGSASEVELKNDCSITINELVMRGYIDSEDDDYNIINPETNEPFDGKILMCYNPATLSIEANYVVDDSQYKCSVIDVETGAALNLSTISGKGYVGGNPVSVNIINSGIERNGFRCTSSNEDLVTCDVSNSSKLVMNVVAREFEETYKEARITIYGKTKNGELSQTYTMMIYDTDLRVDRDESDDVCLAQGESKQFGIVSKNAGQLSVKSSDESILSGDINQTILTIRGGKEAGEASVTVHEANGNIEEVIQKRVYALEYPEFPDDLLLGVTEPVTLNYDGNDSVTITSDTPDILKVSAKGQPEGSFVTLDGEEEFIIKTVGTGEGHLTIKGDPCGKVEKTVFVSNLYIKQNSTKLYVGGKSFKTEIISGNADTYTCTTSDSSIATCKVDKSTVEVIPQSNSGVATITVKGATGGEDSIDVEVIKTDLRIFDDKQKSITHVCSSVDSATNDKRIYYTSENAGSVSISQSNSHLSTVSFDEKEIAVSKNSLNDITGLDGYKLGYNTGIVNMEFREANGNIKVPFDYYVYKIDTPLNGVEAIAGKRSIVDIPNYVSGPLSVSIADASLASVSMVNPSDYSYELNVKNDSRLVIDPIKTGNTTITIMGEKCGKVVIPLVVKGKTFSIPISKGTYTDFIGDKDESSISCTTKGSDSSCEITFPDFKVKNDFEVLGYGLEKDGLTVAYMPSDKLVLNEENDGTRLYANAIVKNAPVCEFRKPLTSVEAGTVNTVTMICKDPSISTSKLSIDDFTISNPEAATLMSVSDPIEVVDSYGREGYTYKLEIEGKAFGTHFDLTLKEGVFADQFDKKNVLTEFKSVFVGKYNSYKFWYIGKENPEDAMAVLYINKDLPDEVNVRNDDYYTLILYGTGATTDFDTGSEGNIPPWIPPGYQEYISDVIIEKGITEIGNANFYALYNLENVTIPEGVTRIGSSAFSFDKKIENVDFPSSLVTIGNNAFEMCDSLETVHFNSGLVSIGDAAFRNSVIREVYIPNTVRTIGSYAFFKEVNDLDERTLESVVFEENSIITHLGNSSFQNNKITLLTIPASVETIGYESFSQYGYSPDNLQTLSFEEGSRLNNIMEYAFAFNSIKNLQIPQSVTIIANFAFDGVVDEVISIGANVSKLGPNFALGDNVVEYRVDENNSEFTSLDGVIFSKDMKKLVKMPPIYYSKHSSYDVPEEVTEIGVGAFGGWLKYEQTPKDFDVNFPSGITQMNLYDNFIGSIISSYNIDSEDYKSVDGVLYNGDLSVAYRLPTHYKSDAVIVPDHVTVLDDYFAYTNLTIKSITIPESVVRIGDYALTSDPNDSLKDIYLNVSDTTEISPSAMLTFAASDYDATYLKNVYVKTNFMAQKLASLYALSIDEFNIVKVGESP